MTEWQPINSVPKNCRPLMLWVCAGENGPHCFAPVSITADGGWWDDSTGDRIEPIREATHWQYAPAGPGGQP